MQDFTFYNPTKYIFGKSAFDSLRLEVEKIGKKVLLTYGSGSIKTNGIYDKVMKCLEGFDVVEFGGIEPNPRLETLNKAMELARKFEPDLILAVGGGSVIDGSKLIAVSTYYEGDAWDSVRTKGRSVASRTIPLGVVLTISATGSEVNGGAVITNWTTHEKDSFEHVAMKPVFSVVDPQVQFSLPVEQRIYGVIDAFSHTLEQYINKTFDAPIQDRFAEGILLTLIEWGAKSVTEPTNYEARANIVFAASMALNELIGSGVTQDWATHALEEVVSGVFDIPHAAGLAIITPRWMQVVAIEQKLEKMAQYGRRVWQLVGTDSEVANQAISKTAEFFAGLGAKMSFLDWGIQQQELENLVKKTAYRGQIGEIPLTESQKREILEACF